MMERDSYWLARMATAISRGQRWGYDDWTADKHILEEFFEEYGVFGECETCLAKDQWVKVTAVYGSNPDVLRACRTCRHEAGFDGRLAA